MTDKKFQYAIGESIYEQRPIVLGQMKRLLPIVSSIRIDSLDLQGLVASIGDQLPAALAIVLVDVHEAENIREAMRPDRLAEREDELVWGLTPELAVRVIEDFFACNPISSISEKFGKVAANLKPETVSNASSISSPEATLPGESSFSGMSTPEQPSPGPDLPTGNGGTNSNSS